MGTNWRAPHEAYRRVGGAAVSGHRYRRASAPHQWIGAVDVSPETPRTAPAPHAGAGDEMLRLAAGAGRLTVRRRVSGPPGGRADQVRVLLFLPHGIRDAGVGLGHVAR